MNPTNAPPRFLPALWRGLWILSLVLSLTACFEEKTVAVSYAAYNYTDQGIVYISINGEGGILNAPAYGEGGGVCCVVLPWAWRPGLKATVRWQDEGTWLTDANGKEVLRDGRTVLVEGRRKEKTVDVPEYEGGEHTGYFRVYFYPHDEVKVQVHRYAPGSPKNPYPLPKVPAAK